MKVLLVEDQVAIRQMLAEAIAKLTDFTVVGEASNLGAAIELYRKTAPDVIVLDLELDNSSGFGLLEMLRDEGSAARVLVFSAITAPAVMQRAYALGALGVMDKMGTLAQLIDGLHTVAAGCLYRSPAVAKILERFDSRSNAAPGEEELTAREREVLLYVAKGLSNKEVASQLGISVHTVENHRANLMRKTGVHSQAKLVMLAIQLGLIQPL